MCEAETMNKTRLSNPLPLVSRSAPFNMNLQPRCDAALIVGCCVNVRT